MRRMRTESPGKSVRVDTALSETTQTSAARAPSPIETARASSSAAIRQNPPGITVQPWGVAAAHTRRTHDGARHQPAIVPHRRGGQPHQLLADEVDAALVDGADQPLPLLARKLAC